MPDPTFEIWVTWIAKPRRNPQGDLIRELRQNPQNFASWPELSRWVGRYEKQPAVAQVWRSFTRWKARYLPSHKPGVSPRGLAKKSRNPRMADTADTSDTCSARI